MNSKTKDNHGQLAAIKSLASAGKMNAKSVEDFVNRKLANVIDKRKLKKVEIKRAIFSHLQKGLVISGPVSEPDNLTSSDPHKKTRPVGFLVNTLRLVDPVSRRALEPGVTLVELRPLRGGEFAFDYIGGDGKVKMASDTHRSHQFGNGSEFGAQPPGDQHFDIEVNHVIVAPTVDDFLPCPIVCTSFHDGREKCHYACGEEDDLGFTIEQGSPRFVSPSDPASQWTGPHKGRAFFANADYYLIYTDNAVIVDVEASRIIRQAEASRHTFGCSTNPNTMMELS